VIARQVGVNAHPRREAATRCEWIAPLLARFLVPYLVTSDGAPAHDRRWLYSKFCARCVGRGVVCWQLMAAMAMGRFWFTRRGGGFPRRATVPRRAGRRVSGRAAAGRRRARGCARCGLRLGYQLYRIIAVPITYWYLYSITLYPGAGSPFALLRAPHSGTGPGRVRVPAAGAPRRSGGSAVRSGARGAVPLLCGLGYAATTCVGSSLPVLLLASCAVEIRLLLGIVCSVGRAGVALRKGYAAVRRNRSL
jgi:hypothetical protein